MEKQVTRGNNIVADGWAGAANPHAYPTPHPNPFPTQTHTKSFKNACFPTFRLVLTDQRTNGPTYRRTDGQSLL